ncbi:uncharacterized protein TNCV_2093101 [Trichonephila clavipes]|nr:uncharacterized protein TNCV_2093101 [Trichonephila clavipes]
MFDILAHHVPQCSSKRKIKKVNKLPTTYRTDYCRKKLMQTPPNIIPQYPGIFIPNQKMSSDTTHKNDFKPCSEKEGKDCRGEIVHHKGHLTCPKGKFETKSETKAVFKYPISKKAFGSHDFSTVLFKKCPGSGRKNTSDISMETSTTYTMSYKKPKNIQKSVAWKPKLHIIPESDMPFKYTSQYQDDYKKPKQSKKCPRATSSRVDLFQTLPAIRSNGMTATQLANKLSDASVAFVSRYTVTHGLMFYAMKSKKGLYSLHSTPRKSLPNKGQTASFLTREQWVCILFTDESRYNLNFASNCLHVRRKPETRYHSSNIMEAAHYGGGDSMMLDGRAEPYVFQESNLDCCEV